MLPISFSAHSNWAHFMDRETFAKLNSLDLPSILCYGLRVHFLGAKYPQVRVPGGSSYEMGRIWLLRRQHRLREALLACLYTGVTPAVKNQVKHQKGHAMETGGVGGACGGQNWLPLCTLLISPYNPYTPFYSLVGSSFSIRDMQGAESHGWSPSWDDPSCNSR